MQEEAIDDLNHHSPSIEKVSGIGGLIYIAPFVSIFAYGAIFGLIGLVLEHAFANILKDASHQKIVLEHKILALQSEAISLSQKKRIRRS